MAKCTLIKVHINASPQNLTCCCQCTYAILKTTLTNFSKSGTDKLICATHILLVNPQDRVPRRFWGRSRIQYGASCISLGGNHLLVWLLGGQFGRYFRVEVCRSGSRWRGRRRWGRRRCGCRKEKECKVQKFTRTVSMTKTFGTHKRPSYRAARKLRSLNFLK